MRSKCMPFAALLALALAPLATREIQAQALPVLPEQCRSEMDARLAFGLCPDRTFDFYATGAYRADVPRPEQVLGYPLGSWHTTYGRMERYLDVLARAAPDRVRVVDYGTSVEHQTMHLVIVGAERHVARLDSIRAGLARLADPRRTSAAQAEAIVAALPAVVWLNAANDGNETAAFEAVLQIAYQLAAGEDARTRLMRDSALTVINLAHNPESHERHVAWYNAFVMGDANPAALEHRAPWGMSTNNNHYQFDLNRDAMGLVQTESRAVAHAMQQWRPQVFVDLHGQTTQMFFPPVAIPINPIFPPQTARWFEVFGRANGDAFDQYGWSYYARDIFDFYYPGYWDTYPGLHGATGMTYETDGGGSKGVRWRRDDGTILTFRDGIAHHFVAGLTTVETAARHRTPRLRDYYEYFQSALATAGGTEVKTAVWLPGNRPNQAATLATTMLRHGVEVRRTTQAGTVTATDYLTGQSGRQDIPAGAYVIDLNQPNARVAATLLVPRVELPDSFRNQELAKFARNARRGPDDQERESFYDVTAWNLVMAHGLTGYWSAQSLALASEPLTISDAVARADGGWAGENPWRAGGASGRAQSAYVWAPGDRGPIRLVARLLDEGFNVAVSSRPLVVDGRDFPRGTFVARVDRNPDALHERMAALAADAGVSVYAARSAFPERGVGTGAEATRTLKPPRIAVLAGDGVRITSFAALWFDLERRVGYPFTALRTTQLERADIEHFDVIVIPEGSYGSVLGKDGAAKLKAWVERGGALIAYGSGAEWVLDGEFGTSHAPADTSQLPADSIQAILRVIDAAAPPGTELPPLVSPNARPDRPQAVPGSFLRGRLDRTHWLTFGYEQAELPLVARSVPLRVSRDGGNPVVFAGRERLVMSGFTWPENTLRTYAGRPYATVDDVRQGSVILFADDPLYRGVYDGPATLLWNAIFLGARGRPDAEGR